jgi:cyclopropane fatty-acyl-phospholipid synthase-like methyltransferase
LDIGCGNARFGKYVLALKETFSYMGIDNSTVLLAEASNVNSSFKFRNVDLSTNWEIYETDFDLVVCFGVLHHLMNTKSRKYLFQKAYEKLSIGGIFIITIWDFLNDEKEKSKIIRNLPGKNNFLLKFGTNATRECHWTSELEIIDLVKNTNFEKIQEYFSDGKSNKLNRYLVLQK